MIAQDRVVDKLLSARFIFVVVVAFVFGWLSIKGKLPDDRIIEIVLLVFYAYFSRSDRARPGRKSDP